MPKKRKKTNAGRPKGGKPLHEDCCSVKERSPEDSCTPCKNYASYRASKCRYVLGQRKDNDKENGTCSAAIRIPPTCVPLASTERFSLPFSAQHLRGPKILTRKIACMIAWWTAATTVSVRVCIGCYRELFVSCIDAKSFVLFE